MEGARNIVEIDYPITQLQTVGQEIVTDSAHLEEDARVIQQRIRNSLPEIPSLLRDPLEVLLTPLQAEFLTMIETRSQIGTFLLQEANAMQETDSMIADLLHKHS
jgi:hypothetical protein